MSEESKLFDAVGFDEPYSIKRHGCTILNCESEPIQTPGCIQSHGALLVVDVVDLSIRQVSENSDVWLGLDPECLVNTPLAGVIGPTHAEWLRGLLNKQSLERNPIYAFTLSGPEVPRSLDVFVHTVDGRVILEFEDSTNDPVTQPDYYALLKQTVSRLHVASTLGELCETAAHEFRALTGLDRVMVYRFHPDQHGEVFAESKRDDLPPWLGLHYPAEDIPAQVRDIYLKIWIRPVPDAKAYPVELVPLVDPQSGRPAELTYCALRGTSVMYTEYLRNMGVAASLTMAIRREGRLWGLIAGHHYSPRTFAYQTRTACEFLAQVVSLLISSAVDREHVTYRLRIESIHAQLVAQASGKAGFAALADGSPNLIDGIQAGGAAIHHGGQWNCVGRTPSLEQLQSLADWLETLPDFQSLRQPVFVTDSLARHYQSGEALAACASGLMAVSVSRMPRCVLLWFRPETIQTINWAGNPHEKPLIPGPNGPRLTPRASFELFKQSVKRQSLPWHDFEIDAALNLRLQLLQVVVSRAEQLAALNSELSRSNEDLNTFAYVASHDLKEPLRGIFKYAYLLKESSEHLNEENQLRLDGLMRLSRRMDALLDSLLHYSVVGRTQLTLEPTELSEVVDEALEMVSARREEARTDIVIPRSLPILNCDRIAVREIFCNLIDNGLKYNDQPLRSIEIGYLEPEQASTALSNSFDQRKNEKPTVFYVRDNGIGIQSRHHDQIFKMFKRLHGRDEYGGGTGAGLCIVRMLVERHHGEIWFDSTPGLGSTFYFTLPADECTLKVPLVSESTSIYTA